MIKLTSSAAKQIRESARQGKMEGMNLRLAATRKPDNSIHYGMGFDDAELDGDKSFESEGINVIVAANSHPLLDGTTIDFVELEPGKPTFIFMNPHDPNYSPPKPE